MPRTAPSVERCSISVKVIGDDDADDDDGGDCDGSARVLAGCSALGVHGFGGGGDVICAGVLFGSCGGHAGTLGFGGGAGGTSACFDVRDNVT